MTRGQYRTLHKWVFIFMGAFILIWCVSGIVMVLPMYWFGAEIHGGKPAIDYRRVTLSPAEAAERLEQHTGTRLDVRRIRLKQVHDRLIYQVNVKGQTNGYIDGLTGEYFQFTPELAEQITRSAFDIDATLAESTRLTEHDTSYPFGQLPVYRVRFADGSGARYFVTESDARVSRSTTLSRLRNAVVSLHAFEPVEFFTHSKQLRINLLVLTGILTILGAIIGYILALPSGRKKNGLPAKGRNK
jgi:uncharacterized iron-regulated membrane protein